MKQYLDLMRRVYEGGNEKGDRTGTGTRSLFGAQMRFDLRNNALPLVTSKKIFVRGLIEELRWIIRGSTDNTELEELKVGIWDGWAVPEDVVEVRNLEGYELAAEYAKVKRITLSDAQRRLSITTNTEGMDAAKKMITDAGIALTENVVKIKKGELGPIYGKQWRAWQCPDGRVVDQLAEVIELLRTKPNSRRLVVTAWNPADLPDESISPQDNVRDGRQSLASCHCLFQFYTRPLSMNERIDLYRKSGTVDPNLEELCAKADYTRPLPEGDEASQRQVEEMGDAHAAVTTLLIENNIPKHALSCQLYQRSCDYFLGVPFNIASYAMLTAMVAQVVNMVPDEFIWTGGDVHLYSNHHAQVEEQLSREPRPGPTLHLNPAITRLEDFKVEDFDIRGYDPHPTIKAAVSV